MKLFLLMLLALLPARLLAQSFYVVNDRSNIYKVTKNDSDFNSEYVSSCYNEVFSIAKLGSSLYFDIENELFKAAIIGNTAQNCTSLASLGQITYVPNSLTVDNRGVLYFASSDLLYSYDAAHGGITLLGRMPDYSGGDLIIYKHSLYMAGGGGILKIDIKHPENSTLVIPAGNQSFFGFTGIKGQDGQTSIYGLAVNNNTTNLVEIDLDNYKIGNTAGTLPYVVFDAATDGDGSSLVSEVLLGKVTIEQQCDIYNRAAVQINPPRHEGTYTYTFNGQTNATGTFAAIEPGSYTLHATGTQGEDDKDTLINIPDYSLNKPVSTYTSKIPVCDLTGSIAFSTARPADYQIKFNNAVYSYNHVFTGLLPDYYHFTILDAKGCVADTLYIDFTRTGKCEPVTFPNTFTPNGDGTNDIFRPNQASRAQQYRLYIYNRWGQPVYQSGDLHQGWAGDAGGSSAPAGVYYWMVTFIAEDGKPAVQKGWVMLLR